MPIGEIATKTLRRSAGSGFRRTSAKPAIRSSDRVTAGFEYSAPPLDAHGMIAVLIGRACEEDCELPGVQVPSVTAHHAEKGISQDVSKLMCSRSTWRIASRLDLRRSALTPAQLL